MDQDLFEESNENIRDGLVKDSLNDFITSNFGDTVKLKDIQVYKPEEYGFKKDNKLHVLLGYESDSVSESSFFNAVSELQPLEKEIDWNPIEERKNGNITEYLAGLEYDNKLNNKKISFEELKPKDQARLILNLGDYYSDRVKDIKEPKLQIKKIFDSLKEEGKKLNSEYILKLRKNEFLNSFGTVDKIISIGGDVFKSERKNSENENLVENYINSYMENRALAKQFAEKSSQQVGLITDKLKKIEGIVQQTSEYNVLEPYIKKFVEKDQKNENPFQYTQSILKKSFEKDFSFYWFTNYKLKVNQNNFMEFLQDELKGKNKKEIINIAQQVTDNGNKEFYKFFNKDSYDLACMKGQEKRQNDYAKSEKKQLVDCLTVHEPEVKQSQDKIAEQLLSLNKLEIQKTNEGKLEINDMRDGSTVAKIDKYKLKDYALDKTGETIRKLELQIEKRDSIIDNYQKRENEYHDKVSELMKYAQQMKGRGEIQEKIYRNFEKEQSDNPVSKNLLQLSKMMATLDDKQVMKITTKLLNEVKNAQTEKLANDNNKPARRGRR